MATLNFPQPLSSCWKRGDGDFPGSPVVKTSCSQCRACRFNRWSENQDSTCHACVAKKKKKKMMVCDYCFFPFLKISFCLLHTPFPGFLQPFPLSRHNFCVTGLIPSWSNVIPMPSSVPGMLQAQEMLVEWRKIQFSEGPLGLLVFARVTIAALAINYTLISFLILA